MSFFPLRLRRRFNAADDGNPGPAGRKPLIFPVAEPGRVYEGSSDLDLIAFRPEALAIPLGLALSLADQKLRGLVELPELRSAIVVFTSFDDGPLDPHHRDLLWKAFGLPVFEQLRGWDGEVIARECEVHDGMHFCGEMALSIEGEELVVGGMATGFSGRLSPEHCDCGLETPRLCGLSRLPALAAAAVA